MASRSWATPRASSARLVQGRPSRGRPGPRCGALERRDPDQRSIPAAREVDPIGVTLRAVALVVHVALVQHGQRDQDPPVGDRTSACPGQRRQEAGRHGVVLAASEAHARVELGDQLAVDDEVPIPATPSRGGPTRLIESGGTTPNGTAPRGPTDGAVESSGRGVAKPCDAGATRSPANQRRPDDPEPPGSSADEAGRHGIRFAVSNSAWLISPLANRRRRIGLSRRAAGSRPGRAVGAPRAGSDGPGDRSRRANHVA